jgi:hypothetical protein
VEGNVSLGEARVDRLSAERLHPPTVSSPRMRMLVEHAMRVTRNDRRIDFVRFANIAAGKQLSFQSGR